MRFLVGDGQAVRLWLDDWVGIGPFCGLFPMLFRLTVNKESSVSDCFEVGNECIVWGVSFRSMDENIDRYLAFGCRTRSGSYVHYGAAME